MASPPVNNSIQMSTPINSLPVKTNDVNNINFGEDPDIENVLKDFEKYETKEVVQTQPIVVPPTIIHQIPQDIKPEFDQKLNYNDGTSFLDFNIAKHVFGLVIIVALLYNTSLLEKLFNFIPYSLEKHIYGYEIYIHLVILFIIF